VLNASIRVKLPRGLHCVGGPATLRLIRLFVTGLWVADVLHDCRQDFLGVIAQLRLRHLGASRHQRLGKDGEFADDFFVVVADKDA
jgi:hypothetical protein